MENKLCAQDNTDFLAQMVIDEGKNIWVNPLTKMQAGGSDVYCGTKHVTVPRLCSAV